MNQQEANKQVVAQYVEALNNGDIERCAGFSHPSRSCRAYSARALSMSSCRSGGCCTTPCMRLTVEAMVAEGDQVAVRYSEHGTFVGPFRGHPPTGKSYDLVAMEWFIVRDGKIRQRWRAGESQARQIGMPLAP
jgi:predicted ester cyclase